MATQDLVLKTVYQLTTKHDVAGLYITHDLAVVAQVANDFAVMLRGEIVERGPAEQVLYHPEHEYTKTLLAAVPDLEGTREMGGGRPVSPGAQIRAPWDNSDYDAAARPSHAAPPGATAVSAEIARSGEASRDGTRAASSTGDTTEVRRQLRRIPPVNRWSPCVTCGWPTVRR